MKGLGLEHKHYTDDQHIVRLVANWLLGIITIIDKLFSFVILTEKYVLILQFIWNAYQTQKSVLIIHKIY